MVVAECDNALLMLSKWAANENASTPLLTWMAGAYKSEVVREATGVALILTPWNFPFQLPLGQLVSAIAAGCPVVVKPSELAPATAVVVDEIVARVAEDGGYPCVALTGGADVARALVAAGPWGVITFTGGAAIGRQVAAAAAETLSPVVLELGGKGPVIVCEDVISSMQTVARRVLCAKCMNAGQLCVAPDYVVCVGNKAHAAFLGAVKEASAEFYPKDGPRASSSFGRMVSSKQAARAEGLLSATKGEVVFGGEIDVEGCYVAPTVVDGVGADDALLGADGEEIFAPILPIASVASLSEALELVGTVSVAPLALYAFTSSKATQQTILQRTRSGGVTFNNLLLHVSNTELPFGGCGGASGYGKLHGEAGFLAFTHRRAVVRSRLVCDSTIMYPPHTPAKETTVWGALTPPEWVVFAGACLPSLSAAARASALTVGVTAMLSLWLCCQSGARRH